MKMLPIMLVNNTIAELQIIVYDCEKIIIERLTCSYSGNRDVPACTVYLNDVPMQYKNPGAPSRKKVLYIDGIADNTRSFHITPPCTLRFMLNVHNPAIHGEELQELRFLLHLSLQLAGRTAIKPIISQSIA